MSDLIGELDASIQARLEADADFQASLADLDDETKTQTITQRKTEELNKEILTYKEGSEKAAKAQELADNYKVRAEKAEKLASEKVPSNTETFSTKDVLALTENKIGSEDYDEVVRIAKILDKPVAEALKDKTMKTILETRAEERRTAATAHIGGGARGSAKVSGEDLLATAQRTGIVPETDDGMRALFRAKMERKLK